MLTGLGFASVYIARSEVVSPQSLTYAAFFLGLYLVAHVVTRLRRALRRPVPAADGRAADRDRPDGDLPAQPRRRVPAGALARDRRRALLGDADRAPPRLPAARVVQVRDRHSARSRCSSCPRCRASAGRSTAHGSGSSVGPFQFQPGEFAKILLIVFLAGYLREKREVLAQGRLKDFGPLLLIWGGAMAVLVQTNDLGSGLLYFGIFLAMLYVATARFVFVVGGMALFLAGRGVRLPGDPARAGPRDDLARPVAVRAGRGLPARAVALRDRVRRLRRHRPRPGHVHDDGRPNLIPDLNTDFIYAALAHELGLVGVAALLLVYMLFVARGFRIAMLAQDGFSKLLAAGLTFGVRAADVHHRRRRRCG